MDSNQIKLVLKASKEAYGNKDFKEAIRLSKVSFRLF